MKMKPEEDELGEVRRRIAAIQKAHVTEIEKRRREKHEADQQLDRLMVGVIEVLDLLEAVDNGHSSPAGSDQQSLLFRKVKRRLNALLEQAEVTEIPVDGQSLTPGLVRVLESRGSPTIEVCRKGFRRGSRVLRPAEVIT